MIDFTALQDKVDKERNIYYILVSGDKEFSRDTFHVVIKDNSVQSLSAGEIINTILDSVVKKAKEECDTVNLVTGDNSGTDDLVVSYATKEDMDVLIYQAHWAELGSKAGYDRNEEMFFSIGRKNHKRSIILWDGLNPYTLNLIYQAHQFGVRCSVYDYKAKRWLKNSEVQEIQISEDNRQKMSRSRREANENKINKKLK